MELLAAKEKAEINEQKLKEAQELAKIGNWELDFIQNKLYWSDEVYRIFGLTPQEFVATYEAFLSYIHPEDRESVNASYTNHINLKQPYNIVHRILLSNNEIKYVRERCKTEFDNDGKPMYSMGTVADITESITIQNELIAAKEKAEESDRLKTAFLHNISHEIRTPMNAIMGFSSLLEEHFNDKSKLKNDADIIKQRSNYLMEIINDILDIAKIESGQLTVKKETFSMNDFFAELTFSFIEYQKQTSKQNINLTLQVHCDSKDNLIIADRIKLKQIFTNLLTNAFKYTDNGKIEGGCKFDANHNLLFYVSDTGIGIPSDKQELIFERFVQLTRTEKLVGGTGLGLSIAKGLVELLNGKIWLESEPGKGTTFYFSFPCECNPSEKKEQTKTIETQEYDFHGKTILVVEDDFYNAIYIKEILSGTGLNILHTEFGKEAVKMATSQPLDLVLMDIRLPDISGYEAIRQIKEQKLETKIIAQTGYAGDDDRQKAMDAGCCDYISKPINRALLLSIINNQWSQK
jgi:PAS domain S-box-containing protein